MLPWANTRHDASPTAIPEAPTDSTPESPTDRSKRQRTRSQTAGPVWVSNGHTGADPTADASPADDIDDQALLRLHHAASEAEVAFRVLRDANRVYRFVLRSQLRALVRDAANVDEWVDAACRCSPGKPPRCVACDVSGDGRPALLLFADYQALVGTDASALSQLPMRPEQGHVVADAQEVAAIAGPQLDRWLARGYLIRDASGNGLRRALPCPPGVIQSLRVGRESLLRQVQRRAHYGGMRLAQAEQLRLRGTCFAARFHILDAVGSGALLATPLATHATASETSPLVLSVPLRRQLRTGRATSSTWSGRGSDIR